ncbi:MAG TPA: ACT domain-containing protein [Gemmatimonadales bacterium]|nr:ACT domain-containing protein [Gemmatimonadales bacterium]
MPLELLPDSFAVCRLEPDAPLPTWAGGRFMTVSRTPDELSVTLPEYFVPPEVRAERGWRLLKVRGPLDMALVGILASLAVALARANISIFAISTYDTDYLLVRARQLEAAIAALEQAGHTVARGRGAA